LFIEGVAMGWQWATIKSEWGGRVMSRAVRVLVLLLALASAPALAQLNRSDGDAFISAMKDNDSAKAVELIEKPGSTVVNYRGSDGSSGLHIALRRRSLNWVGYLLANDADPNLGDKNGDTPLMIAARLGYSEGMARLLMARAQVDKPNKLGETPLIVAAQGRQAAIVRMLLEAGADPDKADHAAGYSARDYAKRDVRATDLLRLMDTVKPAKKSVVGPVRP
jgi:ankyrin repeat protein